MSATRRSRATGSRITCTLRTGDGLDGETGAANSFPHHPSFASRAESSASCRRIQPSSSRRLLQPQMERYQCPQGLTVVSPTRNVSVSELAYYFRVDDSEILQSTRLLTQPIPCENQAAMPTIPD